MAHFQIGASKLFPSGTRLFVKGNSGTEKIVLQAGQKVRLELHGAGGSSRTPPPIDAVPGGIVEISNVKSLGGGVASFSLLAKSGGKAQLGAAIPGASSPTSPLHVVVGDFKNHPHMDIDLLADDCRGSDPAKIHAIHRFFNNNEDNIFNENSAENVAHWGELACGTVAKVGGINLISSKTDYTYTDYHKPLKKFTKRSDVQYDGKRLRLARKAIVGRLQRKIPVLCGVIYAPSTAMLQGGSFQVTREGGHTVLVVGADTDGTTFLYADPYPRASNLKYGGGVSIDPFTETCEFLGIFYIDMWERSEGVLRQVPATQGGSDTITYGQQYIEVVSGPLN